MNSITVSDIKSEKWNKKLVNHLKDDDFFSVSGYPTSSLKILNQVSPDNVVVYKKENNNSEILYKFFSKEIINLDRINNEIKKNRWLCPR